ncbi:MAG TPA: DUF4349 domain-containing protein [Rickettsiales bacterium]|nr:DUF4349 domain-containing protein [Rickettsiales bacterium]
MIKYGKEISKFKNLIIIIVLIILYFFVSSNNKEQIGRPIVAPNNVMLKTFVSEELKVIQGYGLTIELKDTRDIYSLITKKIKKIGGLIDSFNSYNYIGNELAYNFVLEIPSDKVVETIDCFKSLGVVKSENSNAINVFERYSDNENKLKSLYSRRDRLKKMIDDKTGKISDILAIDKELTNVKFEIERLENLNKKIDKNVEYSKLELNILPKIKVNLFNNSQWQISTSWNEAVNKSIIFGQKIIDFIFDIVALLPIIILVFILVFTISKIKNIILRRKK